MAVKTALRIPLNSMFLAGILGLCVLLGGSVHADATHGFFLLQQGASSGSEPSSNGQTAPPASTSSTQQPPASSGQPAAPATSKSSPSKKSKKKNQKDQPTNTAATSEKSKKKVVRHGGTDEPTTQISPSMTEEQAAKTRSNTATLLNETEDNLQKLSGRTLTSDQQETADQIRQFVEQSKAADQNGDLQRAASLANKAKLLSDALVKP